jgi:hypothetical protein
LYFGRNTFFTFLAWFVIAFIIVRLLFPKSNHQRILVAVSAVYVSGQAYSEGRVHCIPLRTRMHALNWKLFIPASQKLTLRTRYDMVRTFHKYLAVDGDFFQTETRKSTACDNAAPIIAVSPNVYRSLSVKRTPEWRKKPRLQSKKAEVKLHEEKKSAFSPTAQR